MNCYTTSYLMQAMDITYNKILLKLEHDIQDIEIESDYSIQRIEIIIELIIKPRLCISF